jgi:hypothetical protein
MAVTLLGLPHGAGRDHMPGLAGAAWKWAAARLLKFYKFVW